MTRWLSSGVLTLAIATAAQAQIYKDSNGTIAPGFVPLVGCAAGAKCSGPISSTNPLPVSVVSGGGSGGTSGGTVAQGLAGSATGAWPVYETVGGAAVTASNGTFVNPATGAVFPVSGAVSITGSVAVTGSVAATQSGAWTVSWSGQTVAATQSGTWNIGSITTLPSLPAGTNVIGSVIATPYSYTPLSGAQYGLSLTTAVGLTVPTGATYAVVLASGGSVNYTTSGTTPTSSIGMTLSPGSTLPLSGPAVLAAFRAYSATGTLNVEYFK